MTTFVCKTSDVSSGSVLVVKVEGIEIGVFRQNDEYFAYRNVCPHQGGPACEGVRMPQVKDVIDEAGFYVRQDFDQDDLHIVCPWHGYEFHMKTGEHVCDKNVRLKRYKVTLKAEEVHCELS